MYRDNDDEITENYSSVLKIGCDENEATDFETIKI